MKLVREHLNEYVDTRTDTLPREDVQKAIDEIRSLGYPNPFDHSVIIINNTLVEVSYFDGYLHLSSIFAVEKGQGYATTVMNNICDIADKYGVTIDLTPEPFGTGERLNKTQLTNWYKKFGFKKDKWGSMKRHPQQ